MSIPEGDRALLYLAVVNFNDKELERILSTNIAVGSYTYRGPNGETPLHAAVKCRNWSALEKLAVQREDLDALFNETDNNEKTALHYAVEANQTKTVKLFIRKSHLMACKYDNYGFTPLLRAAELGSGKMVETILNYCPYSLEFHHRDTGRTALHLARMDSECLAICLTFTKLKDLINERDNEGYTPLHRAVVDSDYEKVFALTFFGDDNWRFRMNYVGKDGDMSVRPVDYLFEKATRDDKSTIDRLLATSFLDMIAKHWRPRKSTTLRQKLRHINLEPLIPRRQSNLVKNYMETRMDEQEVNDKLSNIFFAAGLLLTITFAAAFTIPGGYNEDTGQIIILKTLQKESRLRRSGPLLAVFLILDSVAMIYSAMILMWYTWSFTSTTKKEKVRLLFRLGFFLFWCSIVTILAFGTGFVAVTAVQRKEANWLAALIAGFTLLNAQAIYGTLLVNYFPVRGEFLKLGTNVVLPYPRRVIQHLVKSFRKLVFKRNMEGLS